MHALEEGEVCDYSKMRGMMVVEPDLTDRVIYNSIIVVKNSANFISFEVRMGVVLVVNETPEMMLFVKFVLMHWIKEFMKWHSKRFIQDPVEF